ncbi:MAG: hypothetical protein MZU91_01505 [Desulfosudis oleivorans]|nr:hypothetical protein [Desulfosudis oleivorans]
MFAVTTFILFVLFFQKGDLGYEFVSVYLLVSYYLLLFAVRGRGPLCTGCARPAPVLR